ncbi:hypothetical protein K2E95_00255 [Pseudomonas sp. ERGC3:01]|nr:hypothetical protein [Pseudomonas sp. ERGC3:01]
MELNKWIESVGAIEPEGRLGQAGLCAVASLLGEKTRTVASWYRQERIPSFTAGANIVLKSKGLVDWNGIYTPFAVKLFKGAAHAGD